MVQISTSGVTPNWEIGPPWGAFCQITLTSCSGLLSLPSIALRQDCMETDFSNKFALYCRHAPPLTDLRWFFSKYCNALIRTVVHNVRCVWLTDSCEEVTALSNPHSGCLQPRWAELKTHNGSFHWDYRWVLNLDWCRKSAKKWSLLSFGLSDQRLVIGFQMCCCVSNFVKIVWFFPWDTAIFLASLTEAIAEYWIRTETESQPKSAVCVFFLVRSRRSLGDSPRPNFGLNDRWVNVNSPVEFVCTKEVALQISLWSQHKTAPKRDITRTLIRCTEWYAGWPKSFWCTKLCAGWPRSDVALIDLSCT